MHKAQSLLLCPGEMLGPSVSPTRLSNLRETLSCCSFASSFKSICLCEVKANRSGNQQKKETRNKEVCL